MDTRTWIVLADAASARLFQPAGPRGNWALVAVFVLWTVLSNTSSPVTLIACPLDRKSVV